MEIEYYSKEELRKVYFDVTGIVEGQFQPLNQHEIDMASKWSFAKNKALQICECPVCGEPLVV